MSYGPPQGNPYGGFPPQNYNGQPPPGAQYQQGGGYHQGPPQQGYPPNQGYPPQNQFPPQQQQGQYGGGPPPVNQYPPQQQNSVIQPLPSPGYAPGAQAYGDASRDADALRDAIRAFNTKENVLIQVLSKPDPLQMALLRSTYRSRQGHELEADISNLTPGPFKDGLLALVRGPLMQDVHDVHRALAGAGTNESLLDDVVLGRSNADLNAIKQAFQQKHNRSLQGEVRDDLSHKTKDLFNMVTSATRAEETAPVIPSQLEADVAELYQKTVVKKEQISVCRIISSRSDGQLRAIAQNFQQRHQMTLDRAIETRFNDHMKDALKLMVLRATDRAMTDAMQLEDAMRGVGTNNTLLVTRVVRIHWDKAHMDQVKRAYAHRYKTDLISRIRSETSVRGHYLDLMIACLS